MHVACLAAIAGTANQNTAGTNARSSGQLSWWQDRVLRHCAFAQAYAKSIIVLWQKKAWVDRPTALAHVRHKKMKDFFKKEVLGKGLINCDNLDAQIQKPFYRAVLVRRHDLTLT